jgi:hypothetical protein
MKKIIFCYLLISILFIDRSFCQTAEKKGWPSSERYSFISECIKTAKASMSEDSARSYCYCMQEKMEIKYPTVDEASKITAEDLQSAAWKKEINSCLGTAKWDSAYRAGFMSQCVAAARKSMEEQKAKKYCECMMFKIESKFPNTADVEKLTAEKLSTPEWKKKIQDCLDF